MPKGKTAKSSSSPKPRAGKLATSREIKKLFQAANTTERTPADSAPSKARRHRPKQKSRQAWAKRSPKTMPDKASGIAHPAAPVSRSCSPDPLTAASELSHLLDDKRHLTGELRCIPNVKLPPAHVRIDQHIPLQSFRFLDLPNEIRDIVYEMAIPKDHLLISRAESCRNFMSLTYKSLRTTSQPTLSSSMLARRERCRKLPYFRRPSYLDQISQYPSAVSLFWTCKSVYEGSSKAFYKRSTFHFKEPNTLRHFLDNVTPINKGNIKSLNVLHDEYGHPARTDHAWCKVLADQSWQYLCYRIATECPNLQTLDLKLAMRSCPITFGPLQRESISPGDFTRQWMVALLPLKRLNQLKLVKCRILSDRTDEPVLEVECYRLRQQILGEKWTDEDQAGRDGYGYLKHRKGAAVLYLTAR